MKNNTIILIIPLLLAVSGCEGWLNKEPLAQMSPESFFSNENELQAFSNNFYKDFPGSDLYQENYDLCLNSGTLGVEKSIDLICDYIGRLRG